MHARATPVVDHPSGPLEVAPAHGDVDDAHAASRGGAELAELAARGALTPAAAADLLARHPHDHDRLIAQLHLAGNGFVGATLASLDATGPAARPLAAPALTSTSADVLALTRDDGMAPTDLAVRPRVVELQRHLNDAMDADLKLDGMFGPLTGRAVREFQASIRQPVLEYVDQVTADALYGTAPPEVTPSPPGQQVEPDAARFEQAKDSVWALSDALTVVASRCFVATQVFAGSPGPLASSSAFMSATGDALVAASIASGQWGEAWAAASGPGMAGPRTIGNPLVGLSQGDGLTPATRDRRARVIRLQRALNAWGAGLVEDGKFGGLTRSALDAYRVALVLPADGAVDADTADHLLGQGAHTPTTDNPDALRLHQGGTAVGRARSEVIESAAATTRAGEWLGLGPGEDAAAEASCAQALRDIASGLTAVGGALAGVERALAATHVGPVGLVARHAVRTMTTITADLAAFIHDAGAHLAGASAPMRASPNHALSGYHLAGAGGQLAAAGPELADAGRAIAPVGPTGDGR